ncbi:MAG: glycoside hydrolase family 92 protein, partial [Flavobacteriales bacterium]
MKHICGMNPCKLFALITSSLLLIVACKNQKSTAIENPKTKTPVDYINPFIGTGGHGHTYPGATVPFGMVQLSPDTRLEGWDGCGGYHYSDSIIYGFSHTHLQGTGISDYGDILFMPTNNKLKVSDHWNGA